MDDKILQNVVNEIRQVKEVQGIYLFGSQVKGNARPFSDIDLAVITDNLPEKKKTDITLAGPPNFDISLFWDLPLSIRYRVFKEGKPLYQGNPLFLHRTRASTVHAYLDFKPLIDRHIKRNLGV